MDKVILLAPTPPPAGGIAGWTVRMLSAKLDGWIVSVVDEKLIGDRGVFGRSNKRRIKDEIIRCRNIFQGLKKELADGDAQVVHSCIPSTTLAMIREYFCAGITHKRKRKFIIHFRCTVPNTTRGRFGKFILKKLCNRSDMIIALNDKTVAYLKTITKTQVKLIPNFISEDEIVENHVIKEKIETVLYVGGLVEDKGIFDIITIAEARPDITFRLVGNGDNKFMKYVEKKGLSNVIFVGSKDRAGVKQELMNADVFIFMTYFYGEGFSNALCEAMAAGVPCIATDWAANFDMIEDRGGKIVSVQSPQEAINALTMMEPSAVRSAQSIFNIDKVKKEYTDSIVLSKYVDCYNEIIKMV